MSDNTELPSYNNRSSSNEININLENSLIASTNHIIDLSKTNNRGDSFIYNPPF